MNIDLRNLIALQDLDQKIAGMQKEISQVPNKVEKLQQELLRLKTDHENQLKDHQELSSRRRASEGEVEMMGEKLSRLKDQLMAVKTNREYTAMLHEIQLAEERIRRDEDNILAIMEETEVIEQSLESAERNLEQQSSKLQNQIRRLQESIPVLEDKVSNLREERDHLEGRVETELVYRYRRLLEVGKGTALAEAKGELCTACHVRIRPQVYANLLKNDTIYSCDSCDRILFSREAL